MNAFLVTRFEQLQGYESSYNDLLKKVGGFECLYYSPDYIRVSLTTFRELGASLFFIVVLDGEEVMAVLPLQLTRDAAFGARRTVNFWGAVEVYANNTHQKILADGYQPAAMDAAVALLKNKWIHKWDVISLNPVKADENIRHFTSLFEEGEIKPSHLNYYYFTSDIELDEHLGKQNMKALRRRERRLYEDCGQVKIEIKDRILETDLEEIKALHTARQELKDNDGAFFCDELEGLYMESLIGLWNDRQCVRYYALRSDGQLVAFQIMLHAASVAVCFAIAFDTAFKKYAPMRLLEYKTFRHEIEVCETNRIESGNGEETDIFKLDYSSANHALHEVRMQNSTVRAKAVTKMIDYLQELRRRSSAADAMARNIRNLSTKE